MVYKNNDFDSIDIKDIIENITDVGDKLIKQKKKILDCIPFEFSNEQKKNLVFNDSSYELANIVSNMTEIAIDRGKFNKIHYDLIKRYFYGLIRFRYVTTLNQLKCLMIKLNDRLNSINDDYMENEFIRPYNFYSSLGYLFMNVQYLVKKDVDQYIVAFYNALSHIIFCDDDFYSTGIERVIFSILSENMYDNEKAFDTGVCGRNNHIVLHLSISNKYGYYFYPEAVYCFIKLMDKLNINIYFLIQTILSNDFNNVIQKFVDNCMIFKKIMPIINDITYYDELSYDEKELDRCIDKFNYELNRLV